MTQEEELAIYRKKYNDVIRKTPDPLFRYVREGKAYKVKLPKQVQFIERGEGSVSANKSEQFKAIAFRNPLKGEYYLSGAYTKAYRALNDLSTAYIIVERI